MMRLIRLKVRLNRELCNRYLPTSLITLTTLITSGEPTEQLMPTKRRTLRRAVTSRDNCMIASFFAIGFAVVRRQSWVGAIIVGAACSRYHPPVLAQPELNERGLFKEVVIAIKEHVGPDSLAIDPRPLIPSPTVLGVSPATLALITAAELDARRAVLREMKVGEGTYTGFGNCPGILVPPPPPPEVDTRKERCPKDRSVSGAVALPRVGGAYLPPGYIDQREAGRAEGHFAVRVLLTWREPGGASMTAYDFVMARDSAEWRLVKKVGLHDVH